MPDLYLATDDPGVYLEVGPGMSGHGLEVVVARTNHSTTVVLHVTEVQRLFGYLAERGYEIPAGDYLTVLYDL